MPQQKPPRPIALVTGASAGIGAGFARALAGRGYNLVLVARRLERLQSLGAELESRYGVTSEVLPADLTAPEELALVEARLAASPAIDLLVNNAGFGVRGYFWETGLAAQDRLHRLHIMATMRLTHAALGGLVKRDRGAIINVSSVAAFVQGSRGATYAASKTWMNSFTEGLYLELKHAGSKVRIQALCPGFTYSEFHDVLGMDRKTISPKLWLSAAEVVGASLAGLDSGKLFVVTGWRYQMLVRLLAVVPGGWRRWGTLKFDPRR